MIKEMPMTSSMRISFQVKARLLLAASR